MDSVVSRHPAAIPPPPSTKDPVFFSYVWATKEWPAPPGNTTGIKDLLFPKIAACEIKRWGTSGLEAENGMCILTRNVMNQYIFLMLWWALAFMSCFNVINVLAGISKISFCRGTYKEVLGKTFTRGKPEYKRVFESVGANGRLIILMLARNSDPTCFRKIMDNICPKLIANCLHES
eukprot:sb/3471871/